MWRDLNTNQSPCSSPVILWTWERQGSFLEQCWARLVEMTESEGEKAKWKLLS